MKQPKGETFHHVLKSLIALSVLFVTLVLLILSKALLMILGQPQPMVDNIETGVFNLSAKDLSCPVRYIEGFELYTNSTRIVVEVESDSEYTGTAVLWNVDDTPQEIMISDISTRDPFCVFSNLSTESQYKITLEGISSGTVLISGNIDLGQAVSLVIDDLF